MRPDRRIRTRIIAVVCAVLATCAVAGAQSVDTSFNPGANDIVRAVAVQPDGKILVGGDFTTLGGGGTGTAARKNIGRVNADGSLDTTFDPGAGGESSTVRAFAVQTNGKILVGGYFTGLGGGTGTGTTARSIGRLNTDGSVDTSFNPGVSYLVQALAVQADGKILVGGSFSTLGGGGTGTTTRYNIGRLNTDGSLDTSFNPGANGDVSAVVVQADGKILVVGSFSRLGGGSDGTTTRNGIGRLNADGSLDTSFDPGANVGVGAVAVQVDGKILVGGYFTTLGGGGTGTTTRNRIGRLNADGSLDTGFNPGVSGFVAFVNALVVQADGKILIGGGFTGLGGGTGTTLCYNIGRLNADGSLDTSFNPGADHYVYAVAAQADGKIVVGGQFTGLGGLTGTTTRSRIGRIAGAALPTMALDRTGLVFGAVTSGAAFTAQTAAQTVRLRQTGAGTVTWTAASTTPWLVVSPTSGSGSGALTISTQFASGLTASQTGTITLTFTGAGNTAGPITVTLTMVSGTAAASPPFGSFDTPAGDATVLAGSIAITGWTLDNVGVQRVEIWRDLQAGETTPPFSSTPSDPRHGKVFIANATQVDGARPDVEALYPTTPTNYRAGWGYLLLTWGLFGQGNGTYKLHVFAVDQENNTGVIGSKSVVVSNNTATKPFGSIDTPAIGGDATGPNFGWGLTPKVNGVATCKIPSNGVQVSIDSGPLQPVIYGDARTDIAGAFPGFSNTAGAGGHFIIDWSTLTMGAHTIGWLITDDCNRADGVGSRFFNVTTGTSLVASPADFRLKTEASPDADFRLKAEASSDSDFRLKAEATPESVASAFRRKELTLLVSRGYGELPEALAANDSGTYDVEVVQGERIEFRLPRGFESGYQLGPVGERRELPAGSTWDAASGTFYWQPAPAFLGWYRIVFTNGTERISVRVVVTP